MIEAKLILERNIWPMLTQGSVLVTVNRRLARYLTSCFNQYQIKSGRTVWETPDIIPYSAWLERTYNKGAFAAYVRGDAPPPVLLSAAQELQIWENIIRESRHGGGLLQVRQAAKLSVDAWEIYHAWRLTRDEVAQYASEDTIAFLEWSKQFHFLCMQNAWMDNERLGDAVSQFFQSGGIVPPNPLVFAGFDEWTPQQKTLMEAAVNSGAVIYMMAKPSINSGRVRMAFADAEAETTAAAQWAKARLAENPGSRIGIIDPDLASRREKMIRIFDDVFHPTYALSDKSPAKRAYNVSLGRPLSDYPVIHDALLFIEFAFNKISLPAYGRWLLSPFWAGAEKEMTGRAVLDALIRKTGDTDISMERFLGAAKSLISRNEAFPYQLPVLIDCMARFINLSKIILKQQKPSLWAKDFSRLLDALGWPGDRTLESDEYQTVTAWRDVLHRFAEMDAVVSELDADCALSDFKQLIEETTFQPETADVPVQIMGLLEPAGEKFDHLWIMGLCSESWPKAPHPNPLIPMQVQRKYNVPHCSAEREYEFAARIIDQLLASAGKAVVSNPVSDGETDLYPSPLTAKIPGQPEQDIGQRSFGRYVSYNAPSVSFEKMEDKTGPRIPEDTKVSGGTGLLKAQAACPFSAFAKYRLKAEKLEQPVPGLSAAERGGLVHRALQYIWEAIKSHHVIFSMNARQLAAAVAQAVERALDEQSKKQPGVFTDRFLALEKQRLKDLLIQWMELDKQRSGFTVVFCEEKTPCRIGGIWVNTIVDRIDQLDDGSLVIVDYKTGDVSEKNWFTDRIDEPQLPLYSTLKEEPVAGVLFAQVKKGAMKYSGVAVNNMIAPGVDGISVAARYLPECVSIEEIVEYWREKLEAIATEFKNGKASVSPVSIHTSCRYCDLGPLCRIAEAVNIENF